MASVIQEQASSTASAVTTLAITFTNPVTAGSSICCGGQWASASASPGTVTDNKNGTYLSLGNHYSTNTNLQTQLFTYDGAAAGSTTVTLNCPSNTGSVGFFVCEINGTNGAINGTFSLLEQYQPGNSTNLIKSSSGSVFMPGTCLVKGVCFASVPTSTLVTGQINGTQMGNLIPGLLNTAWSQYAIVTESAVNYYQGSSSVQVEFSDPTNGASTGYVSYSVAYYEPPIPILGQTLS